MRINHPETNSISLPPCLFRSLELFPPSSLIFIWAVIGPVMHETPPCSFFIGLGSILLESNNTGELDFVTKTEFDMNKK